jgi:hypothetical protein
VLSVSGAVLEVSVLGKKYFNQCAELVKVNLPKDEQREDRQLAGTPEYVLILWGCPHLSDLAHKLNCHVRL